MCCHDSNWSGWGLLMREVKMPINKSRLTTTVSMLHECCRLLWMTPSRWEHMVGVWPRWTCCTVVDASVFRRHFGILRRSIWCINHNISDCRCDMLIDHPWNMNVTAAAARLRGVMLILLCDLVWSVWPTCTIWGGAQVLASFGCKIHTWRSCRSFWGRSNSGLWGTK